jgi:hypothetical protein
MGDFPQYTVRETTEEESGVFERWTFDANKTERKGKYLDPNDPRMTNYFRTEEEAQLAAREAFARDWSTGSVFSEAFFSWGGCDICDSRLGGDFEVWHYIDPQGKIQHGERACVDCVQYLANGTLPEKQ